VCASAISLAMSKPPKLLRSGGIVVRRSQLPLAYLLEAVAGPDGGVHARAVESGSGALGGDGRGGKRQDSGRAYEVLERGSHGREGNALA
jgi:hypothetical protein